MEIKKENVKQDVVSCNFCQKGALSLDKIRLIYPYENVITFKRSGSGIKVSMCEDCLKELYEASKKEFANL